MALSIRAHTPIPPFSHISIQRCNPLNPSICLCLILSVLLFLSCRPILFVLSVFVCPSLLVCLRMSVYLYVLVNLALSVFVSVFLFLPFLVCFFLSFFVRQSVSQSVSQSVCLSAIRPFVRPSVHQFVCLLNITDRPRRVFLEMPTVLSF